MTEHFMPGHKPMTERDALMLSPLRLAYIGDAVHDLYIRTALLFAGGKAGAMHKDAIGQVNAAAQSAQLAKIAGILTETEADVVRRGRNAHANHGIPKRANPADYKQATGFEALIGYLYLTGQMERLLALYAAIQAEEDESAKDHVEG